MEPFYYQHLIKSEQAVYHAIKTGVTALEDHFLVPYADPARISMIFFLVRLDCPEIFYAVTVKLRKWPQSDNLEILPEYLFDKKTIRQQQKAMSARVEKLARAVSTKTELEKELYIHDFICENVCYDKLKKPYSHEIIGPLTQGVGVCEGIAKTVKALCNAVQLPCIVALSEAAPERGVKYRHTWNMITVDGQRYHLDATFDNSLQRGTPRYDYFNLDDRHIFRDHETLVLPLPPCTADKGYYYRPLSFTKPEDVENRARQALRKKQPHFVFHWRGGGLNREILTDLLNRCAAAAAERGKCVSCSVNTAQAVVQLDFTDAPAGETLLVQQPDEGNEL